jgi:O-antigen/teichoic acid export membrane protein
MFILAIGLRARPATGSVEAMMNMMGLQNAIAGVLALATAINIGLTFVLIPTFGLAGAATATTLSMCVVAILQYTVARRRSVRPNWMHQRGTASSRLATRRPT